MPLLPSSRGLRSGSSVPADTPDPSFDASRPMGPPKDQTNRGRRAADRRGANAELTENEAAPAKLTRRKATAEGPDAGRRAKRVVSPKAKSGKAAKAAKAAKVAKPARSGKDSKRPKKKGGILAFELSPKKVKREEVMIFARQMSAFVRAGIPLIDALAIIGEDTTDDKLREVLDDVRASLRGGSSLADALERHSTSFPKYFLSMIRSAELTGRLDEVLDQLAHYISRDVETRRKVKSALTYPSVIFLMAIGTIFVLSIFVLPKFTEFFDSFDAELPWATRALISMSDFLGAWGMSLALLGLWFVLFITLATRRERGKVMRDRVFLGIPKLGLLLRTASIERFCRILAALVRAGVPLPDALAVASDTCGNRVYRNAINRIRSAIIRGNDLTGPVAESNLFPAAARQMIRVGESTGTLEEQLTAAAEFYGNELEYRLKRFTDLFEPAIVAFMGIVVGFVAYALVSAMYGVFDQVNK